MSGVRDTLGQSVAGGIWITLRADATGGVSLGGDQSIEPGETKLVPAHIGAQLLATQRAWRAQPVVPVPVDTMPADTASAPRRKQK